MFWKQKPADNPIVEEKNRFFSQLKDDIPSMRKQGDFPQKDPSSFSKYYCDLCNDAFPLTGLRQCTLCGRWACPSCWSKDFYVCKSCHGIYKLHIQPFLRTNAAEDKE